MSLFHLSLEMTRSKKESLASDFISGAFHGLSAPCLTKESVVLLMITGIKLFQDLSQLLLSATDLHCDLGQIMEDQIFMSSASTTRDTLKHISHNHSAKWRFKCSPVACAPLHHKGMLTRDPPNICMQECPKPLKAPLCYWDAPGGLISLFGKCCPNQKGVP